MVYVPPPALYDVESALGVPQLLNSIRATAEASVIDAVAVPIEYPPIASVWGVMDSNGNYIAVSDKFLGLDVEGDSEVTDAPQEQGAFKSYNKVQRPLSYSCSLACDGRSGVSKADFLSQMQSILPDVALYTIVTPDIVYVNSTVSRISYSRTASNGGSSMVVATIHFRQIRSTATTTYAKAAASQGNDDTNTGYVQATSPSLSQTTAASTSTVTGG